MDISNGEGVGVSLFVQGCHFHCPGCFNSETWDFSKGKEWSDELKTAFINLADKSYIGRVSILGGEPLANENVRDVLALVQDIRLLLPDKKIWLYTGYNFDEILKQGNTKEHTYWKARLETVLNCDVVVDGKFQIENQDLFNEKIVFAGSTNQRVIHIQDVIKNTMFTESK